MTTTGPFLSFFPSFTLPLYLSICLPIYAGPEAIHLNVSINRYRCALVCVDEKEAGDRVERKRMGRQLL